MIAALQTTMKMRKIFQKLISHVLPYIYLHLRAYVVNYRSYKETDDFPKNICTHFTYIYLHLTPYIDKDTEFETARLRVRHIRNA